MSATVLILGLPSTHGERTGGTVRRFWFNCHDSNRSEQVGSFQESRRAAAKVTGVSGRGVGMDVVRNVRNLQGTIEIRSKRNQGTAFLIKLPTSLMISKGILLEAGTEQYILPLSNIRDLVKLPPRRSAPLSRAGPRRGARNNVHHIRPGAGSECPGVSQLGSGCMQLADRNRIADSRGGGADVIEVCYVPGN